MSKNWNKTSSILNEREHTLRWFTPDTEVPLCGHATLATARALFETMQTAKDSETETTLEFQTKFKGTLSATINWSTDRISLDFPLAPPIRFSASQLACLPQLLIHLLGPFSATRVHSVHYSPSTKKLLVRLSGDVDKSNVKESVLLKLNPNFNELINVKGTIKFDILFSFKLRNFTGNDMVLGIIVTVKGSGDVNFYSRYFAPWIGINEDPVRKTVENL